MLRKLTQSSIDSALLIFIIKPPAAVSNYVVM